MRKGVWNIPGIKRRNHHSCFGSEPCHSPWIWFREFQLFTRSSSLLSRFSLQWGGWRIWLPGVYHNFWQLKCENVYYKSATVYRPYSKGAVHQTRFNACLLYRLCLKPVALTLTFSHDRSRVAIRTQIYNKAYILQLTNKWTVTLTRLKSEGYKQNDDALVVFKRNILKKVVLREFGWKKIWNLRKLKRIANRHEDDFF